MKQRILIADQHRTFRSTVSAMLARNPQIEVVALASSGEELLTQAMQTKPDIVCMDIDMPGLDAIEATRHLLSARAGIKVIGVSADADWHIILDMLDAGAAGFVSKKGGRKALLRAILSVGRYHKTYLCPEVAVNVLAALRARQAERNARLHPDFAGRQELRMDASPVRLPEAGQALAIDAVQCLQQIIVGNPIATFVIDRNHRVIHWNRACERLSGIPALETLGAKLPWRAFYREKQPLMADMILDGFLAEDTKRVEHATLKKSAQQEGGYENEEFVPGFGETGRWIYFTAAPLLNSAGRVIGVIQTLQDVTERRLAEIALKASEDRYRELSITDTLSGLFNSRHFYEQVKMEIGRAVRYGHPLSLISIDIDNFRRFNTTYGAFEGDRMLEKLARVIHNFLRLGDTAYRKGGKEFAVLLPETVLDCAQKVAERLRSSFATLPFTPWSNLPVYSSVSIGVTCHEQSDDFTTFIARADAGMSKARAQGGNRIVPVTSGNILADSVFK